MKYCTQNCKSQVDEIILDAPEFITYNCWDEGVHKPSISVDPCLSDSIQELWSKGVRTTGCCCGHGKGPSSVGVKDESIQLMLELGYTQFGDREDIFYL